MLNNNRVVVASAVPARKREGGKLPGRTSATHEATLPNPSRDGANDVYDTSIAILAYTFFLSNLPAT